MKVKINTKEKFHILSLEEPILSANMTGKLTGMMLDFLEKDIKNLVVSMKEVNEIDENTARALVNLHNKFYESHASFVICELTKGVADYLSRLGLSDSLNITPTESEAWDIVQLEEMERELLG